MALQLDYQFDRSKISLEKNKEVHLLVRISAPEEKKDTTRKPLNIIAVIDISSSMEGSNIIYVKHSLKKLIEHLTENDTICIITFAEFAEIIVQPTQVSREVKETLYWQISQIKTKYLTNYNEALFLAMLKAREIQKPCRILMFTDGLPSTGVKDVKRILKTQLYHCPKNATVSTFGYGEGHDNEFLQVSAQFNNGNYYYIANPLEIPEAFGAELGGLLSHFCEKTSLSLYCQSNVIIEECITPFLYTFEQDQKKTVVSMPEILYGETKYVIFRLTVLSEKPCSDTQYSLGNFILNYSMAHDQPSQTVSENIQIQISSEPLQETIKDKKIYNLILLNKLIQMIPTLQNLAEKGNFKKAIALLGTLPVDEMDNALRQFYNQIYSTFKDQESYDSDITRVKSSASKYLNGRYDRTNAGELFPRTKCIDKTVVRFTNKEDF